MHSPIPVRRFGSTGRDVVVVGQGSWRTEETPAAAAVASLRRGLDLGMTHIDTAEMYGSGASEKIIGAAIEGRRDDVFLVSKVLPNNASKRGTIAACEKSLARLRTDRLDCYLLHWRSSTPLEETIAAFDSLQRDGKILAWGVSNFDVADLDEVVAIAGAGHPACNQVLYHLQERAIEHAVLPWCERQGNCRHRVHTIRPDAEHFRAAQQTRSRVAGNCVCARRNQPSSCARVPLAAQEHFCDTESGRRRTLGRECRGRCVGLERC